MKTKMSRRALGAAMGGLALASLAAVANNFGTDAPLPQRTGNAADGRDVFRFETFGNERFWTDAVRLPAGMVAAGVTPRQLLQLGLHVDIEALGGAASAFDAATLQQLVGELQLDPSGRTSKLLNDPLVTLKLINANAVIGLPIKDSNGDGVFDVTRGDKVGASCALCHTITDGSGLRMPNGGSIGRRQDGRAPHTLDFGTLLAIGTNSRAYYPVLQLALDANGGATLGRAAAGLTENSSEAAVDAYLRDKDSYPVGMFDDTVDGNGDPMHNMPLFRQDLSFPYGSEGAIARLDNFSNLVYTALLDPTTLTTAGGRAFLMKLGGTAAGTEIADDYVKVLAATGVTGPFPFTEVSPPDDPADAGTEDFPLGVRVDNAKLLDMNSYLFQLRAPLANRRNILAIARGRQVFVNTGCTDCHNVDQSRFVPPSIVSMKAIFPGDNPTVLLPARDPPLNPIVNTPESIFDDKMAVVNASLRGLERGTALPLLLDLARKPVFLHDNSVGSLNQLFDPRRGPNQPHAFYIAQPGSRSEHAKRADLVQFLRSLDTRSERTGATTR